MEECQICSETYTQVRRKKIICPDNDCDEHCCINCFKTYLLTSEFTEPKCMFCNKEISYSFIRKHCNADFCNRELHEKKTDIEMKKQMSLLPATQDRASLEIEKNKYYHEMSLYDTRIEELRREIYQIMNQKHSVPFPRLVDIKNKSDNKITFIQKCTIDDCNGFLSSAWKCGICEKFVCSKCLKQKKSKDDPEHVCNEEDVSSIKAIKKDSKPCPECGEFIFKIDGCDQMYCIKCHHAFSWRTGRPEEGVIHNPHYFQYMRETNQALERQPGDIRPCEIVPSFANVNFSLHNWKSQTTENRAKKDQLIIKITNLVRERRHVEHVVLRKYTFEYDEEFTKYRVDFLLKRLTEDCMRQKVKKLVKLQEKNTAFLQIYNLFLNITGEILKNLIELVNEKSLENDIEIEYEKAEQLTKYCNNELWKLRSSFKNEITKIDLNY